MKIIPFGDRILCKRRKVGEKVGSIILPDRVKERATDIADIISIPELTFADQEILDHAEEIIKNLTEKARSGDSDALITLLRVNEFIKIKTLKEGDAVMISKYVGTEFHEKDNPETLTLVRESDIIGVVSED